MQNAGIHFFQKFIVGIIRVQLKVILSVVRGGRMGVTLGMRSRVSGMNSIVSIFRIVSMLSLFRMAVTDSACGWHGEARRELEVRKRDREKN